MNDHLLIRLAGWVGFIGAIFFLLSIITLQVLRTDVSWTSHYVSDFVNGRGGWLFVVATLAHGIGNLTLAFGLGKSLDTVENRPRASVVLALSALGILVAAVFRTDPAKVPITWTGFVHGAAVTTSFFLELVAVFVLSATFTRSLLWRRYARVSLTLAAVAAAGLAIFALLRSLDWAQGLGERTALVAFMAWEVWASVRLICSKQSALHGWPSSIS